MAYKKNRGPENFTQLDGSWVCDVLVCTTNCSSQKAKKKLIKVEEIEFKFKEYKTNSIPYRLCKSLEATH